MPTPPAQPTRKHLLLGVTGSVAAVKTPELCRELRRAGYAVKVAATGAALTFFDPADLPRAESDPGDPLAVRGQSTLYLDADEWPVGRRFELGEPVLHIELRKWADVLLLAPLDANTLAKVALGLCDNLLTCVYRAWDFSRPVALAPAMNTLMWEHPATARHLRQLLADHGGADAPPGLDAGALCEWINAHCPRLAVIPPQSKRLACGDEGMGGLAAVEEIVRGVRDRLPP
ncbi:MAG TPA: flavoprotein [Armatimonadota bacterium]|nr:flavoprotein [Armatimonadota bacterium]